MENISKETYKWLFYNKVLFVKLEENYFVDGYGRPHDDSHWIPVVPDCVFSISVERRDVRRKYSLCIVDQLQKTKKENGQDEYSVSIHHANAAAVSDWIDIFNYSVERRKNPYDNYTYEALLWFLVRADWQPKQLDLALKSSNSDSKTLILNVLTNIGICLPLKKQEELQAILRGYQIEYKIYLPEWIPEAVKIVKPDFDKVAESSLFTLIDLSAKNFFEQVDNKQIEPDVSSSNKLIKLYSWLKSDDGLDDYQFLIDVFSFMIDPYRLQIVKRYLHDVRLKRTTFDPQLFAQFKNNKYGQLIRYRLCIVCPSEPIILTVPLLCDCILTLYHSQGKTFQKIDGLLDFAITRCNPNSPRVDFKMERFIPTCKDAIVRNHSSFFGFISYQLICSIDEEVAKKSFYSFPKVSEHEYLVSPKYLQNREIESLKILRMRIEPRSDVQIGLKFDFFGFWKEIKATLTESDLNNEYSPAYMKARKLYGEKESHEILERTKKSLANILGEDNWKETFFEVPYDTELLEKLKATYLYQEVNDYHVRDNWFLSTSDLRNRHRPYCSPTLSSTHFPAVDLPYFWCRGKECFRNALGNQTLNEAADWKSYSLYHLLEIIGYNVLEKTEAGYEPNEAVRIFLAIAYKAMRKFERLKCRECGHLLFPHTGDQFNRYNYYSCRNQNCTEYNKAVYLNYCYQCKKGLIDSRDSKQCKNGWFICPNCVSCCSDEQFERLAEKYIIMKQPVPSRIQSMRGHGHNNRGQYFCPSCGGLLEEKFSEGKTTIFYCQQCQRSYNVKQERK